MSLVRFSSMMPDWFDRFFDDDLISWSNRHFSNTNTTIPAVNIKEDGEGYTVEMSAPGFDKKDFKIELENDVLTISSDKKIENEVKEGERFTRREFSYQSFSRSFTLPQTVENDKIKAKYENGILSIQIPKKEEAKKKPVKQIEIK